MLNNLIWKTLIIIQNSKFLILFNIVMPCPAVCCTRYGTTYSYSCCAERLYWDEVPEVRSLMKEQSTQGARYEIHKKRTKEKKETKWKKTKGMCGVATKRGSHASLYRARGGAWASEVGGVISGVRRLTWRAMNESGVWRAESVGERRSGVPLASHFPSSQKKSECSQNMKENPCTSPSYKCSEVWHV